MNANDNVNVLQLLHTAYGGTKEERTTATAELERVLRGPNGTLHLLTLLRAGMDGQMSAEQSLSALLYAKNCLLHTVSEEQLLCNPQLLLEMEAVLLSSVGLALPDTHRRVVRSCAAILISGYEWNYLPQLLPCLDHVDPTQMPRVQALALLEMIYTAVRQYKIPEFVPMAQKSEVSVTLLRTLAAFVPYNDLAITHQALKLVECVVETMIQSCEAQDQQHEHVLLSGAAPAALMEWFDFMVRFPEAYFATATSTGTAYVLYVKCMKRIGIIVNAVLQHATRTRQPAAFATSFVRQYTEAFLQIWQRWLAHCITSACLPTAIPSVADAVARAHHDTHHASELAAMRFVELCAHDRNLYDRLLRPHALALIEQLLFPYLCMNDDEDGEPFADETDLSAVAQYMVSDSLEYEGAGTTRRAAGGALLALLGVRPKGKKKDSKKKADKGTEQVLLHELLNIVTAGLALPDTPEQLPRIFGFLHLFCLLRGRLRAIAVVWREQVAQILMHHVAPRLRPGRHLPVPLRCKAIATCEHFCKAPMPNEADFASFVAMHGALLTDDDNRVRLYAVSGLCALLTMRRARPYLRQLITPLMEACLYFMGKVHTSFVPSTICFLVDHYTPELTAVLDRLGNALVQHFLAATFDLQAQEEGDAQVAGTLLEHKFTEQQLQQYEQTAFSADVLLSAIATVVHACADNADAFLAIRPAVMQLLRRVLEQPDNYDFLESALGIFMEVVELSHPIPTECWQQLLPLLFQLVDAGTGIDYFAAIESVLDNFLSTEPLVYLGDTALMEATLQTCQKMLIGNVICGSDGYTAAAQLLEALLHQAKGNGAQTSVLLAPYLPRIVQLLLQALVHPDIQGAEAVVRVWLVAAMMDCCTYDAAATVAVLHSSGAFQPFFDGLLHLFRGALDSAVRDTLFGAAPARRDTKSRRRHGKTTSTVRGEGDMMEALQGLSLLTRKVCVLGLSSLLRFFAEPAQENHPCYTPFVQRYAAALVQLAHYCIFTNESTYRKRCTYREKQLRRAAQRAEDTASSIDDATDSDGVSTGSHEAMLTSDSSSGEEDDGDDGTGSGDSEACAWDEADDYSSPIDDVNEVGYFQASLQVLQAAGQHNVLQAQVKSLVRSSAEYERAAHVAQRYRELGEEEKRLERAQMAARRVSGAQIA